MYQQNFFKKLLIWCLYEWATSAFFVVILTFVFSAYFTSKVAANPIVGTHQWANALAISGLCIAILSPFFGAIADYNGKRKIWLVVTTYSGILSCAFLWFAYPQFNYVYLILLLFIIANFSLEVAMVFYNALITNVAPPKYLGRVSGIGWSMGYFGGLSCLLILLFVFVLPEPKWLDINSSAQIRICAPIVALWILIFTSPLLWFLADKKQDNLTIRQAATHGLEKLAKTLKTLPHNPTVLFFLLARMIYTDGLNTLFAFGGIYAAGTFGMSMTEVLEFGAVLNLAAGIGALAFAWLDDALGSKKTILIALLGLIIVGFIILIIHSKIIFWCVAPIIGLFVGPSQAASRTYMAKLANPEQLNEMFGLYALSGKATAFIGPFILGEVTYYFQSQRLGMATILVFFIVGGILLLRYARDDNS